MEDTVDIHCVEVSAALSFPGNVPPSGYKGAYFLIHARWWLGSPSLPNTQAYNGHFIPTVPNNICTIQYQIVPNSTRQY